MKVIESIEKHPARIRYFQKIKDSQLIAGVDEVGRGPLAGAVVAAAVILGPAHKIEGLDDSKKVSEKKRSALSEEIQQTALAWAIGRVEVEDIDRINILQASLLAMSRAIDALPVRPEFIFVDGNRLPKTEIASEAVVKGDHYIPAISAASILAKVYRDDEMIAMDERFPGYGFAQHKGYPTKVHIAALNELGPLPIHRKSFGPVKLVLQQMREAEHA